MSDFADLPGLPTNYPWRRYAITGFTVVCTAYLSAFADPCDLVQRFHVKLEL